MAQRPDIFLVNDKECKFTHSVLARIVITFLQLKRPVLSTGDRQMLTGKSNLNMLNLLSTQGHIETGYRPGDNIFTCDIAQCLYFSEIGLKYIFFKIWKEK